MEPKTTQRAYTLRLKGDPAAMAALWTTHEAVNRGVKAFGDWLLTLRGGLDHSLQDLPVAEGKGDKKTERAPTDEERRDRRILLALSWLSVESADGAPKEHVVATGKDSENERRNNVAAAFEAVLKKRGLNPAAVKAWVADCRDSLAAAIRDDAVWVNRSEAFDITAKLVGRTLTREEVWDALGPYFVSTVAYLQPAATEEDGATASGDEKAKDLVQKAGQWLSSRFGEGEGADFGHLSKSYEKIAAAAAGLRAGSAGGTTLARLAEAVAGRSVDSPLDALLATVSAPGHKSATINIIKRVATAETVDRETIDRLAQAAADDSGKCAAKTGDKGHRPYADRLLADVERACGLTYLQEDGPARHWESAVMLDHAARRVSIAHSWQKLAEANRRKFAADARRRAPVDATAWLDRFLADRSVSSNALGPLQIRRRAIDGWDKVVQAWSAASCKTGEDRKQAARELQDALDKFGDITLFEALATDDARCVWIVNGKPSSEPLKDYVYARDAEAKMRRFKVPAYRHPDPLRHPVFCDFGKSRWRISFAVHQAALELGKTSAAAVEQERALAACRNAKERAKAEARLGKAQARAQQASDRFTAARADHGLSLALWDGASLAPVGFSWQSKRFAADFALDPAVDGVVAVSRADRAGRAAAGAGDSEGVRILNVFAEDDWNGRLQAPRAQLDRLAAYVDEHGWDDTARGRAAELQWLVSFSARLQLQDRGPWPAFIEQKALAGDAQAFSRMDTKGVMRLSFGWPHSIENKERSGLARLDLCRLAGLRVLSIDLGHRYAAACAVWETLTEKQLVQLCKDAGRKPPAVDTFAVHLAETRAGKRVKTIYRRTGPDMWARLDRQFTIRLQGEDEPARKASPEELAAVTGLELALGRVRADDDRLPHSVSDLMGLAVSDARLGLRRHGDRARIAFNLTTDRKPMPGGGWLPLTDESRVELLADTLELWQNLFAGNRWRDAEAEQLWNEHIRVALPEPPGDDASGPARRAYAQRVRALLPEAAAHLAADADLRKRLHDSWAERWSRDDREWFARLRWLRGWLLPRGAAAKDNPATRHVGGLSLDRLSNIRELWQLMKAHRTRPEPDDVRKNVPAKDDSTLDRFGQRVLDALERMRNNRVKQLASRVAEAALGIGSENRQHWQGGKRPRAPIADPRFAPCHAIVTENLELYRPEQTRTRRENRMLMRWSSAKVFKHLSEACELHGLLLKQVMPNYTSRQDSRAGAPGLRCADLPANRFLKWYAPRLAELHKKDDAHSRYLAEMVELWQARPVEEQQKGVVRILQDGGELFVSADKTSPAAAGLQADLNAAANIGLRALLDPDWPGRWWWVPCGKDGRPAKEKCKGTSAFDLKVPLLPEATGKARDITNAWRDASAAPVEPGGWQTYTEYWNKVRARVVERLREWAERDSAASLKRAVNDIPFEPKD